MPRRVLYFEPDNARAESTVAALEAAAPELSVVSVDSVAAAHEVLDREPIDCVVTDWYPRDAPTPTDVEAIRSRIPEVPVVWLTERPPDDVVDAFDGITEYVCRSVPDAVGRLLAHRIRSVVDDGSSPSDSETESAEQAAETRSETIVDRSYAGILVFDAEGHITLLNPAAETLLDVSAAEMIGSDCESLDMRTERNESLPLSDRPVARVLSSGQPVVDELVSIPVGSGRRWLSISASPLANGETVGGVVVTLADASATVELETTLETVLDRMTDGFLAFDTDLRFTYFSKQAVDTDRYPTEKIIGSRLSELHPHLGQYESDLREVLDTQEPKTVETYVPEPTGAWYRARLYPSETGVSVFFREISDEKQQERQLEQYKTIVESVQDGVCILDANLDFVFVNEAFTELVDYSADELLGENAALVTDQADIEIAHEQRAKLFAGDDDAAILSGELTTGSGDRMPVETWLTPIELVDGEQGTVGVVRDLSYRRQTKATFTTLYDAAHELLSAQSTEAVASIGVDTATSVLGFADATVFSYDAETNAFEPLAYTPSAEARLPTPLPMSASDSSITGRAFFESELIVAEDMSEHPDVYNPETAYRRAMFIPLDEHGVLFVGDTDPGTTSDQIRTVAELLGTTLATAFSRLSSERRSEAHQQTLAERTAKLETLTHTNALVEVLSDRLLTASTREEVDTAVCSALTEFDRYRFAWVGTVESRTDTIVPQASSGTNGGYLDWLCDHIDAVGYESVTEPTCRTLMTTQPATVDRIAHDWQTAPWRKEALSRGYQSVLSVPLVHNEIVYGVLSIYAENHDAFDEYIRTVLAAFGRLIAYVIKSTETKRGLLADHQTEVGLDITDGEDVIHSLAARLGTTLSFEGFVPQMDHSLLYFTASEPSAEAVEAAASEVRGIESLRIVTTQAETTLFEAAVSGPVLAATLVDCGAIPTRIDTDGERQQVVVMIPQTTDVRAFIERLGVVYPSTTVRSRCDRDREIQTRETFQMELLERLTHRQQETLRAAYFARYFDSPRGSTGTEVGQSLGISQPTFNYHLRAALKTILTMLFEEMEPTVLDT